MKEVGIFKYRKTETSRMNIQRKKVFDFFKP